jgi:hypothetical protein
VDATGASEGDVEAVVGGIDDCRSDLLEWPKKNEEAIPHDLSLHLFSARSGKVALRGIVDRIAGGLPSMLLLAISMVCARPPLSP